VQPAAWCAGTTASRWPGATADSSGSAEARALPEAGLGVRSRVNADPRFARNIERFTQFLTCVGLTALLVGGVGVANAVRGFVDASATPSPP
jgi:putative ABC transport system permease protein